MAAAQAVCKGDLMAGDQAAMIQSETPLLIENLVGGVLSAPANGQYFDVINPATAEVIAHVPDSTAADLDKAVAAAQKAFPAWRDTSVSERAKILNKLADLIETHFDEFVQAEVNDNGKPLQLAENIDIPRGLTNFRAYAEMLPKFTGQDFVKDHAVSHVLYQPIGVVSTISPWNLPFLLFTWKLAPALAAGNCVIAKPSEVTPVTAYLLSKLVAEAGVPEGVLSILHGKGPQIGAAVTAHPEIKAISFTGGTATGKAIYQGAAAQLKKVSLELGGKNPTIVFEDADLKTAVAGAKAAAFTNQGQVCLCGSRLFVQESIYEEFKAAFVKAVQDIKIGDPLLADTEHGATVSEDHMKKVLAYIDLAQEEGGSILCGGQRVTVEGRCQNGYFIAPTVIEGLPHTCRTNQEEIFGPVVTIIPFADEDEVLAMANSTEYGLAASIWTLSAERAKRVSEKIESGIVWVNCWNLRDLETPFGGVKNSGVGREGVWSALRFFSEEKTVTRPPVS